MSSKSHKEYPILGKENLGDIDLKVPRIRVEQNIKLCCPFCESVKFVRRGTRKKKHEVVQLYKCANIECKKTFTDSSIKGISK